MELYTYKAKVIRVVDGDTVSLEIDLGLKIYYRTLCRLYGINTPELNSLDVLIKQLAFEAKDYLSSLLPVNSVVEIYSKKLDKYGRPESVIINNAGINVNEEMINTGHAKIYL